MPLVKREDVGTGDAVDNPIDLGAEDSPSGLPQSPEKLHDNPDLTIRLTSSHRTHDLLVSNSLVSEASPQLKQLLESNEMNEGPEGWWLALNCDDKDIKAFRTAFLVTHFEIDNMSTDWTDSPEELCRVICAFRDTGLLRQMKGYVRDWAYQAVDKTGGCLRADHIWLLLACWILGLKAMYARLLQELVWKTTRGELVHVVSEAATTDSSGQEENKLDHVFERIDCKFHLRVPSEWPCPQCQKLILVFDHSRPTPGSNRCARLH